MERNPQRELLVSCGMWCVAWRLSPRYCLSSSQQQSSWALTPHVPCGLEVCTPSTWKEIQQRELLVSCGMWCVAWRLSPRYCLSSSQQQGSWALTPRVPCGLEVCTPSTWKEIRSVSCWFHAVVCGVSLGDFRLATACHLRNNKAVGHLLLVSRVVLRFARPAHGKKSAA